MRKIAFYTTILAFGTSLGCAAAGASDQQDELFTYRGKNVRATELAPVLRKAVYQAELERYKKLKNMAEDAILAKGIADEAAKTGVPRQTIERRVLGSDLVLTESQVREYYERNVTQIPYPFETIKSDLKDLALQEKKQELRRAYLAQVVASADVSLLFEAPKAPLFKIDKSGLPVQGPTSAAVSIVEFGDYSCPHCREAQQVFSEVLPTYKDRVSLAFADAPVIDTPLSKTMPLGAYCAGQQQHFWEFHDQAYQRQGSLGSNGAEVIAAALGLNITEFKSCEASATAAQALARSKQQADSLGITTTPTLYINGRLLFDVTPARLRAAIDAALAEGSAAPSHG